MKDLIQEGRKIQETFKKNIVERRNLNEGVLYNIWKKVMDTVERSGLEIIGIATAAIAIFFSPIALPIGLILMDVAYNAGDFRVTAEKYFANRYFDKKIMPVIQELIKEMSSNSEIKNLISKFSKIKSSDDNKSISSSEYKEMSSKIDGVLSSSLDKILNSPKFKDKLDSLIPDRDSAGGKSNTQFNLADDKIKWIKQYIIDNMKASPSEYNAIKSDAKEMRESLKR